MRIERQSFIKCLLCQRVVVGFTKAFHHATGVGGAETAMG